jgi:hypothetical protein
MKAIWLAAAAGVVVLGMAAPGLGQTPYEFGTRLEVQLKNNTPVSYSFALEAGQRVRIGLVPKGGEIDTNFSLRQGIGARGEVVDGSGWQFKKRAMDWTTKTVPASGDYTLTIENGRIAADVVLMITRPGIDDAPAQRPGARGAGGSGAGGAAGRPATPDAILKELRELREEVSALRRRVEELERKR